MVVGIACFVGGVLVGAVAGYFVRRNNEKCFAKIETKAGKVKDAITS